MNLTSAIAPTGTLTLVPIRKPRTATPAKELGYAEIFKHAFPQAGLPKEVNEWRMKNIPNILRGLKKIALARALGLNNAYGTLSLVKIRPDGTYLDYGIASMRVVTTVGVNFIVDAFQNSVELENLKYHGIGTGGTAEAVGDTALVTELTTQYNPDSTRATGTTTEGGTANVYRTVGTNTVDASVAITEHGIFDQAATGGGTLLDRSLFSVINLASGDSLQSTYDLTLTAGS